MNGGIGTQKASYMKKQVQISFGIWINKMYKAFNIGESTIGVMAPH